MVDYIHLVWHMVDIIYPKIIFSITVIMLLPVTSKQKLCRIFILTIGLLSKTHTHSLSISLYLSISNTHLLVEQTLTQTHGQDNHNFGDYRILWVFGGYMHYNHIFWPSLVPSYFILVEYDASYKHYCQRGRYPSSLYIQNN
jgi:hypothetical protein